MITCVRCKVYDLPNNEFIASLNLYGEWFCIDNPYVNDPEYWAECQRLEITSKSQEIGKLLKSVEDTDRLPYLVSSNLDLKMSSEELESLFLEDTVRYPYNY